MYHPGGFGGSDNEYSKEYHRKDPSVLKPVLLLIGILFIWVGFLIGGISFGFGWYAWPAGTIFLIICLIFYSIIRRIKNGPK